jgi:hypothetical protein
MQGDGEDEERRRLERERKRLEPRDRLYGYAPRRTADGFPDQRSERRTGRVVQMPLRVHPRVKAMMLAIKKRDNIPSLVMLLELMVEAYLKEYGPLDEDELPTLEQLVEAMERERDRRDG